jgi:two-component system, OmpR family, sensor histidine kinase QseC
MLDSLKTRLIALCIAALLVIGTVTGIVSYNDAQEELGELLDAHLAQTASLLSVQHAEEIRELDTESLPPMHRLARSVSFQIWRHGNTLTLRSANAPTAPLGGSIEGFSDQNVNGEHWRVFSVWDREHENLIHVAEKNRARSHLLGEVALHLLTPLGLALPMLALLLWLAVGAGLRPLARITRAVARRAPDRLDAIDLHGAPREVRPLVEQLNLLFARIATSLEQTRRFTADAAHELRTPLAAIHAQAQVAAASPTSRDRTHALQQVLQACDQAGRLIGQLLTLARLDANIVSTQDSIALREQLAECMANQISHSLAKRIELVLEEGAAPLITGQAGLLQILWRNLLDNAIRYSPEDSEISVTLRSDAEHAYVEIADHGPGISPEEREQVFERFHRILGSGQSGSGLGLSIAARIVEIHHGNISLKAREEGPGLCVCTCLPLRGPHK